MTTEQTNILATCHRLTASLASSEPPKWQTWNWPYWHEQTILGPRYEPTKWFGPMSEAERMRYRRACDALAEAGLVRLNRACGKKFTNLQLTEAGEQVARELTPAGQPA